MGYIDFKKNSWEDVGLLRHDFLVYATILLHCLKFNSISARYTHCFILHFSIRNLFILILLVTNGINKEYFLCPQVVKNSKLIDFNRKMQ